MPLRWIRCVLDAQLKKRRGEGETVKRFVVEEREALRASISTATTFELRGTAKSMNHGISLQNLHAIHLG